MAKGQYLHARLPLEERFWRQVQKTATCWLWTGNTYQGYGKIGRGGRGNGMLWTHRVSWEIHFGPIPKGKWVLHTCDNPPCVRPDHLFLGTQKDNMADAVAKGRMYRPKRLTAEDVATIRALAKTRMLQREIADQFGVSRSTVGDILAGRTWGHLA